MKRKFIAVLLSALVLSFSAVHAQEEQGGGLHIIPRLGLGFTTLLNQESEPVADVTLKSESRKGLAVGVDVETMLAPRVGFMPGLHYFMQGCRFPDYSSDRLLQTDASIRLHYLALPLRLRWHVAGGFSVASGLQVAYLLNSRSTLTVADSESRPQTYASDINSICRRVDFAVPVEAYYEWHNVELGVAYSISINKLHRGMLSESRVRNSAVRVTFGYNFAL